MTIGLLKDIYTDAPKGTTLLGLDVGKKTIGLALGDVEHGIATPLETIKRTKFTQDMKALSLIIKDYEIGGFVIGLPVNMDGGEGPRAQSIRDFAIEMEDYLKKSSSLRTQGPHANNDKIPAQGVDDEEAVWIALWDERLSTVSVEESVDSLVNKRKIKANAKSSGLIDKLAAQIILQGALDFIRRSA